MPELMTTAEHTAVATIAEAWNQICQVVGDGETREADLGEVVAHIHALQHFVMAQAAGRAYPAKYRLSGRLIGDPLFGFVNRTEATEIPVADHPRPAVGTAIVGCAICTLRIRCGTSAERDDAFRQLAGHNCVGARNLDAGEPLILPCLICDQLNDVTLHWHCPRCRNTLGYTPEAIEAERARRRAADREMVTEYLGEAALEDPPDRDRSPITPSYTEGEWADVLAEWLATKRCSLIGRSWPAATPEDRRAVAAELAGWLIEAAGEVLE